MPDSLSLSILKIYLFGQVFKSTYSFRKELLNLCLYNSAITGVSMCILSESVAYEFVPISPAMPRTSCSSYFDGLGNGKYMAEQLLFGGVLLPGFVENSTYNSYVVPIQTFSGRKRFQ